MPHILLQGPGINVSIQIFHCRTDLLYIDSRIEITYHQHTIALERQSLWNLAREDHQIAIGAHRLLNLPSQSDIQLRVEDDSTDDDEDSGDNNDNNNNHNGRRRVHFPEPVNQ